MGWLLLHTLLNIDIPLFHRKFGGTTIGNYIWFAVIVITTFLLKKVVARFIALVTSRIATNYSNGRHGRLFRGLIRKPVEWLVAAVFFFIAFNYLEKPLNGITIMRFHGKSGLFEIRLADLIDHVFLFFAILFTTLTLSRLVDFIYRAQADKAQREENAEKVQLLPLVKDVAKLLLWTIAFFWVMGVVFGVNVPALITGLGIGGVAIALAAKESIENLFASFTILADKPFQADDVVRLGALEGRVERIGFRSTRLRSEDGSLFIIPNKKLIDENLENLTQRDTRRVQVVVNIKYGVAHEALNELIAALKEMVQQTLHVSAPVSVSLENFNENVFQLYIVYHLPHTLSFQMVPQIKQEINLKTYDIVMRYTGAKKGEITAESAPLPKPDAAPGNNPGSGLPS